MTEQIAENYIQKLWENGPFFVENTPHSKVLGIKFVSIDKGRCTLSLPYKKALIGNPETRVLHGGAVTTLLDQTAGFAAISAFTPPNSVATLNLGIDYLRPAEPGSTIIAQAHCYKVTRHVAFVRGIAHEGDDENPIATCQGKFMATGHTFTVPQAPEN